MKKLFYAFVFAVFCSIHAFATTSTITYTVSPTTFNETDAITITFTVPESTFGVASTHTLYLWGWSFDTTNTSADCPTNGTWAASGATNKLTYVSSSGGNGTYTFTMNTVKSFYGNRANALTKIGFLVKTATGGIQSQDILLPVGKFQLTLVNPAESSTTIANSGTGLNIIGTPSLAATYQLKANGTVINTVSTASTSYSYNYTITQDAQMELIATSTTDGTVQSKKFNVALTPVVSSAAIPSWMRQGITYDPADPTRVGLAIYAPNKAFVHVIGSFNNWAMSQNYCMYRDTTNTDLFWIIITGLTAQQVYTFQYRTTSTAGLVVKVADPFSRLVLSPDDDPYISATTYPNLPTYPTGQQYDVSVVQTGMPAYNWQVTNFTKPAKNNLTVYELLVRDFTAGQTWTSTMAKIPYLKSLGINAIELMPVMEFDGNNSWGYNPGFHFALDKAYGTSDMFKLFIDTCHQNGIAVILDIALNHATGRSPIERMWANNTTDGGYGSVASNNPYFNVTATHTYGVFYDLNHGAACTNYYVNRVLEQWITEYKVDGFRWDLTKGFTQNCTGNQTCTDSYQQDRVDVLKKYADYEWSFDPTSLIIFEHLGTDAEEQQWTNYKDGIMQWNNLNYAFGQNTMGYTTGSSLSALNYSNHGFTTPRADNYGESHDEERLMYYNLTNGATNGSYTVKDLNTALYRMQAVGAVLLTIPGPKMIWQFGELGYDKSIGLCSNGTTIDLTNCKTDPKPNAFTMAYDTNANRLAIYNTWAKILQLRKQYPVFSSSTFTITSSGDLMPKIYIWDTTDTTKNIVIFANFTTSAQAISPYFPYTGTWYNLMDNTTLNVTDTTSAYTYTLQPGDFRIYGNALTLATDDVKNTANSNSVTLKLTENPASNGVAKIRYANARGGVISVYDLNGRAVKTYKLAADKGDEPLSINGIKTGVYILALKAEQGTAITKMIVK